jgi:hypothetical protein
LIASKLEGLALLEEALHNGKDEAERAHVIERAQLPGDGEASRQFRRYYNDACSKSLRCLDRLPKMLERDAEGFFNKLAAKYDEPASPLAESGEDDGGDAVAAPADDLAAGETGSGEVQGDCADQPSEDLQETVEPTAEQDLASQGSIDDEPSAGNPAEPAAVGPAAPEASPDAVPVRPELTSDDFPVEDMTEEELKQFAPEILRQEQLQQKIDAIYGTGSAKRDPAAGQPPAADRGPPAT